MPMFWLKALHEADEHSANQEKRLGVWHFSHVKIRGLHPLKQTKSAKTIQNLRLSMNLSPKLAELKRLQSIGITV